MSTSVLVTATVAAVLLLWAAIQLWFRRRRKVTAARLHSAIAADTIIRSPEPGSYRGATVDRYPTLTNDGSIALTARRLVFRMLTGGQIEIPVDDIVGVRVSAAFDTARKAGRQHLVIRTSAGEIAFFVDDIAAWITSLTTVATRPLEVRESTEDVPDLDVDRAIRRRLRTRAILAVVFTSIGLASGLVAGIGAAQVAQSISGDRHAEGTVVDLSDTGRGYAPVVEFEPPGSAPIRFTSSVGSNPPMYRVGEHVDIRYDTENPQDASIDEYWQQWLVPTLFGIFATIFLVGGVTFGVLTLAARRQTRRPPTSRGRSVNL